MAQAPNGVIYVGTGETFARGGDGSGLTGFIGKGLYKFSPGATSLTLVKDSTLFGNINEVAVDPTSNNKIYVAGDRGLFVSTDAGTTFALGNSTVSAMDVKVTDVLLEADAGVMESVRTATPVVVVITKRGLLATVALSEDATEPFVLVLLVGVNLSPKFDQVPLFHPVYKEVISVVTQFAVEGTADIAPHKVLAGLLALVTPASVQLAVIL